MKKKRHCTNVVFVVKEKWDIHPLRPLLKKMPTNHHACHHKRRQLCRCCRHLDSNHKNTKEEEETKNTKEKYPVEKENNDKEENEGEEDEYSIAVQERTLINHRHKSKCLNANYFICDVKTHSLM